MWSIKLLKDSHGHLILLSRRCVLAQTPVGLCQPEMGKTQIPLRASVKKGLVPLHRTLQVSISILEAALFFGEVTEIQERRSIIAPCSPWILRQNVRGFRKICLSCHVIRFVASDYPEIELGTTDWHDGARLLHLPNLDCSLQNWLCLSVLRLHSFERTQPSERF